MTLPEIGILSALSIAGVASAVLAVVVWPVLCGVLLTALAAGAVGDVVTGSLR